MGTAAGHFVENLSLWVQPQASSRLVGSLGTCGFCHLSSAAGVE